MRRLIILFVALSMILLSAPTFAEIPHYMQFQGKATDAQDTPLNGAYKLTFRIYDAESGGNRLWSETHNSVGVENGVFSVLLGGVTPLNLSFDKPYWISIEVDTQDGKGEMSRQMITSVGYAYRAKEAERAKVAETATSADNSGKVVQVVNYQTGEVATGTTIIPRDDTIPQNTEGDEYMTLAITPTSATNKLKIEVVVNTTMSAAGNIVAALFQDSTANALAAIHIDQWDANQIIGGRTFTYYMTTGTTSETTFKVRIGPSSGTLTFNGTGGARRLGGVMSSSITITEIQV